MLSAQVLIVEVCLCVYFTLTLIGKCIYLYLFNDAYITAATKLDKSMEVIKNKYNEKWP